MRAGLRPEQTGAAESFYREGEAARYQDNARMAAQQRHLADRALHLLDLPKGANGQPVPALLLDAGCGTGFSGAPLEQAGHTWIGVDIAMPMLMAARPTRRSGAAQLVCDDLGRGFGFRCGTFDGCVSISAVQWLCHATRPEHEPKRRVAKFFRGLRAVLAPGRRAVLQLYPEQPEHMDMLRSAALDAGFSGGLVVDYPWSERSKKLFLVLVAPTRDDSRSVPGAPLGVSPLASDRRGNDRKRTGRKGNDGKGSKDGVWKGSAKRRAGGSNADAPRKRPRTEA